MDGLHEVQHGLQPPHANPSNHRTGLAFWTPPASGHGTGRLHGWYGLETYAHELTAETDGLCDSPAVTLVPAAQGGDEKQHQDGTQGEPLQPRDRQGPVQAPMSGSAPPNVAQAAHGQASTRPSTSFGHRQDHHSADHDQRTESPCSVYSTPTRTHPLIPAPLFTSPPHSRRQLDPRVPDSPYDRLAHVLSPGRPTSQNTPTKARLKRDGDDTTTRYTADGIPIYRQDVASLRSLDTNSAACRRIVSVASNIPAPTCAGNAAVPSKVPLERAALARSPPPSVSSTALQAPLPFPPRSQPQTKRVQRQSGSHESSSSSAGLTVIRSAALPILLPIAAAEGIIRPRRLPRPVTLPLSDTDAELASRTFKAHNSSSTSVSASIRAMRGKECCRRTRHSNNSDSFYTAASQTPLGARKAASLSTFTPDHPARLSSDRMVASEAILSAPAPREAGVGNARKRRTCSSSTDGEKSVGETLGWLLRVCFCQPVGGVEDLEGGGDNTLKPRGGHRRQQQGSSSRQQVDLR